MLLVPAFRETLRVAVTGVAQSVPVSETWLGAAPLTETENVLVPLTTPCTVSWCWPAALTVTPLTVIQLAVLFPMNRTFEPPEQPAQALTAALPFTVLPAASASYELERLG